MNEKHSYEKHLADKFEQLPPPGSASQHWPQMKALLDNDLPEGGGKGPGGFGRWWMYAIVGGIIVTATLWISKSSSSTDNEKAPVISAVNTTSQEKENQIAAVESNQKNNSETTKENNQKNIGEENEIISNDATVTQSTVDDNSVASNADSKEKKGVVVVSPATLEPQKSSGLAKSEKLITTKEVSKDKNSFATIKSSKERKSTIDKKSTLNSIASDNENKSVVSVKEKQNKNREVVLSGAVAAKSFQKKSKFEYSGKGKAGKSNNTGLNDQTSNGGTDNASSVFSYASLPDDGSSKAKPSKVRVPLLSSQHQLIGPGAAMPDSMNADYALLVERTPVVLPAPSRFKTETDRTRALKNRIVGTGDDKQFVFGLSLPLAFPIGTQENLAFNINAGPSTLSDFLPVPHFQYHLSDKAYLQTEFQFIAPQYIQSVLLFQKRREIASATNYRFLTSSIYAKKLYYFNLPVVAYYSPFKNFYLGTGLQYSKLLSGIALYEDRVAASIQPGARDSLSKAVFKKFRNDSVSNKLAGHDFRFIFDANYYWHRFTVGMRYTQGLSDFVSIQLTNNSPIYSDRNKSLQFYLRYNIWEDMRKKKPALVAWR